MVRGVLEGQAKKVDDFVHFVDFVELRLTRIINKVAAFPPEVALTPKSGWVTVLVIKSGYRCQCLICKAPSVHYNALVAPLLTKH